MLFGVGMTILLVGVICFIGGIVFDKIVLKKLGW